MWVAFALWAAVAWDRIPQGLRAAGAIAVGLVGLVAAAGALFVADAHTLNGSWGIMDARWTAWKALHDMPVSAWLALRPMLAITAVSFVFFSVVALYFVFKAREKLAAVALAVRVLTRRMHSANATAWSARARCCSDATATGSRPSWWIRPVLLTRSS